MESFLFYEILMGKCILYFKQITEAVFVVFSLLASYIFLLKIQPSIKIIYSKIIVRL